MKFEQIKGLEGYFLPTGQTELSAGLDVKTTQDFRILPHETIKVGTGVKISEIDPSLYLQLHIRSSLRFKHGLTQLGTGIIDADFKDEIRMLIKNEGTLPIEVKKGARIGQLIVCANLTKSFASKYYMNTKREGGFGSTDA